MEDKVEKKYFGVDDGGAEYIIVARDVEHAKQVIRDHGIEFTKEDGDSAPIDDPAFASLSWDEIPPERAAALKVSVDDGRASIPLADAELGDFFCSEW
jgi:hypothetical protein